MTNLETYIQLHKAINTYGLLKVNGLLKYNTQWKRIALCLDEVEQLSNLTTRDKMIIRDLLKDITIGECYERI